MSTENPPTPPELKVVPPPRRGGYAPITRDLYDRMTETYLHGTRAIGALSRAHNIAHVTAKKAIEVGWPKNGWDALKERARLYDKLHNANVQNTSPERAERARDFLKMREDYIEIAAGIRVGLAKAVSQLLRSVDGSVATQLRPQRQIHMEEILDAKGRIIRRIPRTIVVDVQVPPSIHAIAASLSQVAGALERTGGGELEQLLARVPSGAASRRGHRLSDEQIAFMAENQGRLPPGVKLEDLG